MASAIRCRRLLDRLPFRNEVQVADSSSGKPLALHDVQSKPWTFSIKRNRAEIGYSESSDEQKMVLSVPHCGASKLGTNCRPTYE